MHQSQRGFSLIELSIVLVILGLLTGGILSGQSLVRASELRAVTTEYQKYVSAARTFQGKYFALPGDMSNATRFWGKAHANAAVCEHTASTGALTCDGDGDGKIADGCTDLACSAYNPPDPSNEGFRFWQHLANAGLIEGQFDGIMHGLASWGTTTANAPKSRLGDGLWFVWSMGYNGDNVVGSSFAFDGNYGNFLQLGSPSTGYDPYKPLFSPRELWNLDTKMDDGMPASGKMVSFNGTTKSFNLCTDAAFNTSTGLTAGGTKVAYKLTEEEKRCSVVFRGVF